VERGDEANDAQCVGWGQQVFGRRRREEDPVRTRTAKRGRITAKRAFGFTNGWAEEQKGEPILIPKATIIDSEKHFVDSVHSEIEILHEQQDC
jgi:hypothetical protein